MPGCVLRLFGPCAELSDSLRNTFVPFTESIGSARARERGGPRHSSEATFNYLVSDADGAHVPQQIQDVELFLSTHREQLIELRSRPGVEGAFLDFGWQIPRESAGQFVRLPLSLLSLCVAVRVEIETSVYLVAEDPRE